MNFEEQTIKELKILKNTEKPIVIVGAAILGKMALKVLEYYNKKAICFADNNEVLQGKKIKNIPICSMKDAVRFYSDAVFILCVAIRKDIVPALKGIKKQLDSLDFNGDIISPYSIIYASQIKVLKRKIDSSKLANAIQSFSVKHEDTCKLPHLDICVTSKCSLNCKNCSALIPYRKPGVDADRIEIVKATKKLFSVIDGVRWLQLFGGEPLLYKDLLYVAEQISKIDNAIIISIVTNGTILPTKELLSELSRYVSIIFISNYGVLSTKLKEFVELCDKVGIVTNVTDFSKQPWIEMGNFKKRYYSKDQITNIYNECKKDDCLYKITPDCKFILCERQLIPALENNEDEIIELNDNTMDLDRIRNKLSSILLLPYISACDYCKSLVEVKVPPAVQVQEKLKF